MCSLCVEYLERQPSPAARRHLAVNTGGPLAAAHHQGATPRRAKVRPWRSASRPGSRLQRRRGEA